MELHEPHKIKPSLEGCLYHFRCHEIRSTTSEQILQAQSTIMCLKTSPFYIRITV